MKNCQGQKLGRKGKDTRDRIVEAARQLIVEARVHPMSLSAVARHASIGMSSIYTYFKDMTELVLAVLEPVGELSESAYIRMIRDRWPDDQLDKRAREFVHGFHGFWEENSRLLHLRNQMADQQDLRMIAHRIQMAQPVMTLLARQMDASPHGPPGMEQDLASVLFTGLERVVTMATDAYLKSSFPVNIRSRYEGGAIEQQGRVLALAILAALIFLTPLLTRGQEAYAGPPRGAK